MLIRCFIGKSRKASICVSLHFHLVCFPLWNSIIICLAKTLFASVREDNVKNGKMRLPHKDVYVTTLILVFGVHEIKTSLGQPFQKANLQQICCITSYSKT